MRWGLINEAETELGTTHHRRYHQLVEEIQFAEEMGFEFWGSSEQHGLNPIATISAPEVFYAYVAAKTTKIRLRHQITMLPFRMNHPIRVAERIATLDIVSHGRAELGVGRGNNPFQFEWFGVDPKEVRGEMMEALEVIGKALSAEEFEHKGDRLTIPPMKMTPRPVQHPQPPIHMVATSMESHRYAGEMGIGCISFDNWLGWDHCRQQAATYREAIQNPTRPIAAGTTNSLCATAITGYCAESVDEAKKAAGWIALTYLAAIAEYTYGRLAKESPDYQYMAETGEKLKDIIDRNDLDALMDLSPAVLIGTPDDFVQRGRQLEELGFDEITMRIEGMGHENVMRSLELIGKHVIPEFKAPNSIARTAAFDIDIRVP